VIVWADVHDCLVLSIESLTAKLSDWEETLKHMMSHGLSAMMMPHDFLSRRITPL
jgi:hypothetical protein